MQSLRIFIEEKKSKFGIRTSLENFNQIRNINIVPLYAIEPVLKAIKDKPMF
jgi:uncharacterized protein